MATLKINEVTKVFPNGFQAIHSVNVDVADGEFLVIVGPSGCGKSTLLRMVAGLEIVTGGEIQIDGITINKLEPAERNIAMVFQNYALYPHMNVYKNMAYGLKNRKVPKSEIDSRVRAIAKKLELEHLLERRPSQLSGGQRQRVAMGRAIVRQPAIFLFDEPLSNLDAKLRMQMRFEIRQLQNNLKVTSLYVTHDQIEALTLGDRLVIMNQGRVEQIGTPLEVYTQPASVFVAGFIGSPPMNFIPAEVDATGKVITIGKFTIELEQPINRSYRGKKITLGFRPEHITINKDNGIPFNLKSIELIGSDSLVYGTVNGDLKNIIILKVPDTIKDTDIKVQFLPDKLHFFCPETKVRIKKL